MADASRLIDQAPPPTNVSAADVRAALPGAPMLVVFDDDPTGTQTVRDLPVLTRWSADDVSWAIEQRRPGFYVLTNTRSLAPEDARRRIDEIMEACLAAAVAHATELEFVSRGDSTLRSHFPVEVDAIRGRLASHDRPSDGTILVPAYIDAGRVTIDGVHRLRVGDDVTDVADSEFARDATFGYTSSHLGQWVAEKTSGTIAVEDVVSIDLSMIRGHEAGRVRAALGSLRDGRVATLDALEDSDLRRAAIDVLDLEKAGSRFVFQAGPSFVRARLGQDAASPLSDDALDRLMGDPQGNGLVIVGSHVALTTRQLAALRRDRPVVDVELDVARLLAAADDDDAVSSTAAAVAEGLRDSLVVLSTSRTLVRGADADESLDLSRRVSAALSATTRRAIDLRRPAYVVAKGGITSSDIATEALGLERAWVRGSLLPGIVSLWQTDLGRAAGLPYVVFAGNVGQDDSLSDVVGRLESSRSRRAGRGR